MAAAVHQTCAQGPSVQLSHRRVYAVAWQLLLVLRNLRLSRAECALTLVRDLLRTVGAGWRQAVQSCLHAVHGSVVADRSGLTGLGVHDEDSREWSVSSVIGQQMSGFDATPNLRMHRRRGHRLRQRCRLWLFCFCATVTGRSPCQALIILFCVSLSAETKKSK